MKGQVRMLNEVSFLDSKGPQMEKFELKKKKNIFNSCTAFGESESLNKSISPENEKQEQIKTHLQKLKICIYN